MPFLEKYTLIKEGINTNDNHIKTYKAKREFIIKEIFVQNDEEKLFKIKILKGIETDIKIYDIIEKENSIFVVIDSDEEISNIFEKKIKESIQSSSKIVKEVDITGESLTLSEIQNLYNIGEKRMCKININKMYGSGFFLQIDNYKDLNIPFKKALFTNNHVIFEKMIFEKLNLNITYINNENSQNSKYLNLEEIQFFDLNYKEDNSSNIKRR